LDEEQSMYEAEYGDHYDGAVASVGQVESQQ